MTTGHGRFVAASAASLAVALGSLALAQSTSNPYPTPIAAAEGVIAVRAVEFASLPDVNGEAARMMLLVDQPGTRRLFVNTMLGSLYSVSYDGKAVAQYLDVNAPNWQVGVQSSGAERGFQSFAFHPQFSQAGTRGFGKFYTYTDTSNTTPKADFLPSGGGRTHDTVLLEWTAKNPAAAAFDGGSPRELLRVAQPFTNHNGGHIAFNPTARSGSTEFGLLYIGSADGGSGGDPFNHAQDLGSAFGKILRIDPLGSGSSNGQYGVPPNNPFIHDGKAETLAEIYAYGLRNPQRLSWDSRNGNMFVADIGQNIVEKVSLVTSGANLGWNVWEGSFTYGPREVGLTNQRGGAGVTYPFVEYDHTDPLLQRPAVTGVYAYRESSIGQLAHLLLFGDNPSGEIFAIDADNLPSGGQASIRRVLLGDNGAPKTLLQLIRAKNVLQGKPPARRADLRLGAGPQGQIFVLNKRDGTIRLLVPGNVSSC